MKQTVTIKHFLKRFWCRIKPARSGCWIWSGGKNNYGYGIIRLDGKQTLCHRIMYFLTKGNTPKHLLVMHKCNNKLCVNPAHLSLGTIAENLRSAAMDNLYATKLTPSQVKTIRSMWPHLSQTTLAKMFSISQPHICRIINGKRRQYVN